MTIAADLVEKYEDRYHKLLTGPGDQDNANVDGSVVPQMWRLPEETEDTLLLYAFRAVIGDTGSFAELNYGGISGPLTNGMRIGLWSVEDDSLVVDLCMGYSVTSNVSWSLWGFDTDFSVSGQGSGSQVWIVSRYDFSFTKPLLMASGTYFGVEIRDDLTGLDSHFFSVKGLKNKGRAGK